MSIAKTSKLKFKGLKMSYEIYGKKAMESKNIVPVKIMIVMSTLANLSLNDFIDNENRICIVNDELASKHKTPLEIIVNNTADFLNTLSDKDKSLLNVDRYLKTIIDSEYSIISPELLCVLIAKNYVEAIKKDNQLLTGKLNDEFINLMNTTYHKSISTTLTLNYNEALKDINDIIEGYTDAEELDTLNGNMWELAEKIILEIEGGDNE